MHLHTGVSSNLYNEIATTIAAILISLISIHGTAQENPFGSPVYPVSHTTGHVVDAGAGGAGMFDIDEDRQNPAESTYTFSDTGHAEFNVDAESAEADAEYSATFSLDVSSATISGTFTATSSGTANDAPEVLGSPSGSHSATHTIIFQIESGSAMFDLTGTISGMASGGGSTAGGWVELVNTNGFEQLLFIELLAPNGGTSRTLSESIVLQQGQYRVRSRASGRATGSGKQGGFTSNASINVDITVAGLDAEEIFWDTNDGDFDTAENWDPQQVPNIDNIAIFDRDAAPYTVTLENPAVSRLILDRGSVTFDGLTFMAAGGDADIPAVIVGDSVPQPVLFFMDVDDVSAFHTIIANAAGTTGSIALEGLTEYANGGPLVVGARGSGTVNIGETALINTQSLVLGQLEGSAGTVNVFGISGNATQVTSDATTVGRFANGVLSAGNTRLETGETVIGQLPGSDGTATINQGGGEAVWEFDTALTVGDQGMGMLDAHDRTTLRESGAAATPVRVAAQSGSDGVLTLRTTGSSLTTTGDIFVGPGGSGEFDLIDGARLSASMMFVGPTFESDNPNADGSVTVGGTGTTLEDSQVTLTGDLIVGDRGSGDLFIANEATVQSNRGLIATEDNGDAEVTIQNAVWRATTVLTIGTTEEEGVGLGILRLLDGQVETDAFTCLALSSIEGSGLIFAATSDVDCSVSPNSDIVTKGATRAIGTLQFDGDVNFNGATITIDAASTSEADMITVTGDADLANTTIQFNFIDGYLPQTGDALPFLMVDGALTIDDNTILEYTGAADGFDFDITPQNGMLMFAANNAQPEAGEGQSEGNGEGAAEGMGEDGGCPAAATSRPASSKWGDWFMVLCAAFFLTKFRKRIASHP